MTKEELLTKLQYFQDSEIGVSIYAILKSDPLSLVKLDIEGDAESGIQKMFLTSIKNMIIDNNELHLSLLSSSDDRNNTIYEYDLEYPEEFRLIDGLNSDDIPLFNYQTSSLSNIKAILIELGNEDKQVILYKTIMPVNVFTKDNYFLKLGIINLEVERNTTRFSKINDDFFRISSGFQFFKLDGSLFIYDLKSLESGFKFHDIIKNDSKKGIEAIKNLSILANIEVLEELVEDVTFARKLVKIATNSPVIQANIPNDQIVNFCKEYPALKNKIKFNSSGDKIFLDTKVSKNLFIQLMLDNLLTSELTKFHYSSLAKDNLEA